LRISQPAEKDKSTWFVLRSAGESESDVGGVCEFKVESQIESYAEYL
jgi:hypothetical protein